ncbi:F-box protein SKIP28-like [Silene latifolia]|uniref:F-box protein SKIP28-like n=1 Tax=Silene latifolia TaxID=37657 RepID=UPI003D788949
MEQTGDPHEALFLVLSYLPLLQLLSMSQVTKSLRHAVRSDVLIWMDLVVEKPLNYRLSDQNLIRIASNAQGRLRTLALLGCFKITDHGLRRVIYANPLISKLYVPACTGLTPEIILEATKTLTKLKQVKIDSIPNFKQEHLQELINHFPHTTRKKPRFYHKYGNSNFRALDEDTSSIDVEECPKCKEVKLVFDCPRESCGCLGCGNCIQRCEGCGICLSNEDDEQLGETLCNDILCLDCWLAFRKCDYCNKSFCPRHADEQLTGPGGFVCENCKMKLLDNE